MNIITCPYCKVRYKDIAEHCPVCRKTTDTQLADNFVDIAPTEPQWRKLLLVTSFCLLLIPCAVGFLVNSFLDKALTWSLIVSVSIAFTWLCLLCIVFFYKLYTILFLSFLINTVAFFFALYFFIQHIWLLTIALPVTGLWIIAIYGFIMWVVRLRNKGINIIATIGMVAACALILTEAIISFEIKKAIVLSWSLIVAVSIVPFSFVLFYLHKHKFSRWMHL